MVHRAGYQTFEFRYEFASPNALYFSSVDSALAWLNQLHLEDSGLIHRLRSFGSSSTGDPEFYRSTDQAALRRFAILLHLRKILVTVRLEPTESGKPSAKTDAGPAFPLSERSTRVVQTTPSQVNDPPTFGDVNAAAQAAALMAAAASGAPFCQECQKQAAAAPANNNQ